MGMPTWEIVLLTLTAIAIGAVGTYFIIRCLKSIQFFSKNSEDPQRPHVQHTSRKKGSGLPEVYGVPYRSPAPQPRQLDPAKLDAVVMQGKSDIHPYYLEKKHYDMSQPDLTVDQNDHQVAWNGDAVLLHSEFQPSWTSAPDVHSLSKDTPSVVSGESHKPKKVLHIKYDKGNDGAPEIKAMTTDVVIDVKPDATDASIVGESQINTALVPVRQESVSHVDGSQNQAAQIDHVVIENTHKRNIIRVPIDTWVDFDNADLSQEESI